MPKSSDPTIKGMQTKDLVVEHRKLNKQRLCINKARKYALKTEIHHRAVNKGDQEAVAYAKERSWQIRRPKVAA